MLPGRDDSVGDAGTSSTVRFRPALTKERLGEVVKSSVLALERAPLVLLLLSALAPVDVCAAVLRTGFSSSMGDGRGGGMSVPSVSDANLKLSAGSSKRLDAGLVAVADPFVTAGIVRWLGWATVVAVCAMVKQL